MVKCLLNLCSEFRVEFGGKVQEYNLIQTHISIPITFLIALKFNPNFKFLVFIEMFFGDCHKK